MAIADNYSDLLTSKSMAKEISVWVVDFLNSIAEFLNKDNLSTNKYMFLAYIGLSRKLYKSDDWKESVVNIISAYDFNRNNENNIYISNLSGNLNKATKNMLYKLF